MSAFGEAPYDWGTVLRVMLELDPEKNQMPINRGALVAAWTRRGAENTALRTQCLAKLVEMGKLRGNSSFLQLSTGPQVPLDGSAVSGAVASTGGGAERSTAAAGAAVNVSNSAKPKKDKAAPAAASTSTAVVAATTTSSSPSLDLKTEDNKARALLNAAAAKSLALVGSALMENTAAAAALAPAGPAPFHETLSTAHLNNELATCKPGQWFPNFATAKPLFKRPYCSGNSNRSHNKADIKKRIAAATSTSRQPRNNNDDDDIDNDDDDDPLYALSLGGSTYSSTSSGPPPVRERPSSRCIALTQARNCHRSTAVGPTIRAFLWPGTPPWVLDPEGFFKASNMPASFVKFATGFLRETGMQQRHLDLRWQYLTDVVLDARWRARRAVQPSNVPYVEELGRWRKILAQCGLVVPPAEQVLSMLTKSGDLSAALSFSSSLQQPQQQQQKAPLHEGAEEETGKESTPDEAQKRKKKAAALQRLDQAEKSASAANATSNSSHPYDKRLLDITALFQLGIVTLDPNFDDDANLLGLALPRCCNTKCEWLIDLEYPPECLCGMHYCCAACWLEHAPLHRVQCELRLENQMLNVVLSEYCAKLIQDGVFFGDFYPVSDEDDGSDATGAKQAVPLRF